MISVARFLMVSLFMLSSIVSCYKPFGPMQRVTKGLHVIPIAISSGIEVTDALKDKINSKIGSVIEQVGKNVVSAHVSLSVEKKDKKHSDIFEATIVMKGGVVVRAKEASQDMYASIDLVKHRLGERLKKLKKYRKAGMIKSPFDDNSMPEFFDTDASLEKKYADELGNDKSNWEANFADSVKTKKFPMPPISVQEAIAFLDLIDHPFYVFRNIDSNEINVVYKREGQGAGLIQPEVA